MIWKAKLIEVVGGIGMCIFIFSLLYFVDALLIINIKISPLFQALLNLSKHVILRVGSHHVKQVRLF